MKKARVYLDGLNFYYGVAREYNFKWIDVECLFRSLLYKIDSQLTIEKIIIFTALVVDGSKDKGKKSTPAKRQDIYLKALKAHSPLIDIKKGYFTEKERIALHAKTRQKVRVILREEKETDVNFACQITEDAHTDVGKLFDVACICTNDGDMSQALQLKKKKQQEVILISPRTSDEKFSPNGRLTAHVPRKNRISFIEKSLLEECRLPNEVVDKDNKGKIWTCPKSKGWS